MSLTITFDLQFRWYDLWVGLFVDTVHHTIYICPLPMCVIKIAWEIKA